MHDFLDNLNTADWVCLVVLLFCAAGGFLRGFSREAVNLGAWLGAGWLSVRGTNTVLSFLPNIGQDISQHAGGNVTAHLVVLLLGRAGLNSVANALSIMGRGVVSSGVDTTLGVVFGALRGYFFLILAALTVSWASPERLNDFMKNSIFAPSIFQGMKTLQGYLPKDIGAYLETLSLDGKEQPAPSSDKSRGQAEKPVDQQEDIDLPPDTDSSDVEQ